MKVFLDERCLMSADVAILLRSWRQIADFAAAGTQGALLFLDRDAAANGIFLQRLNALSHDYRVLYRPMVFGSELVKDWRPIAIALNVICQLATENGPVDESAICEVYEHCKSGTSAALMGHDHSSYVNQVSVGVTRLVPHAPPVNVLCGTTLADFKRIASVWGCLVAQYDASLSRPPRDHETVLRRAPGLFTQEGRIERNGRRHVYREIVTNRLYYVDNLHYGIAAHLEVFDNEGRHLGTADLDGNLDAAARVPGRTISW